MNCKRLDRLSIFDSIYDKCAIFFRNVGIKSNLSQIVHDSHKTMGYWELINILKGFPLVKIIEFKNADSFHSLKMKFNSEDGNVQMFGDFEKFTFNYRGQTQMKNLKKIFENTNVQLVPVCKNLT